MSATDVFPETHRYIGLCDWLQPKLVPNAQSGHGEKVEYTRITITNHSEVGFQMGLQVKHVTDLIKEEYMIQTVQHLANA